MKFHLLLLLLITSSATFAAPISVTNQQSITSSGQLFNFNFAGLPTSGTSGQFSITLNGDYSGFNTESAVVTLDIAGGNLDIGNQNFTNGIVSNTITGLTLNNYSITSFSFNDVEQSWLFDISDLLLGSLLADGSLTVIVQNDSNVDPFAASNADFVQVGFNFNSTISTVPEPNILIILGFGLMGVVFSRRRVKA